MTKVPREKKMVDAQENEQEPQKERSGLNILQVMSSVFAAGLGVQSREKRERDFKQGKAGTFIAAGIIFTLIFIVSVLTVVNLVLKSSGN
ncbi:MAG: hypothetical protein ACI9NT_001963 [Bacteroidia bacterium]|jgi:hypothetical protein